MKALLENLKKLPKNSITLLETLISVLILLFVVGSFSRIPNNNQDSLKLFSTITNLENSFATKNYSNFSKTHTTLQVITDGNLKQNIDVVKVEYEDENIKVYKYEK